VTSKLRPSSGFGLAFVMSIGLLAIGSSNAADNDDHSYLPPWMLSVRGETGQAGEKADPQPSPRTGVQPEGTEAQSAETERRQAGLNAKASEVKARLAGFVGNLFRRSIRFATGE
jgi:multidrug resistance efflux pump